MEDHGEQRGVEGEGARGWGGAVWTGPSPGGCRSGAVLSRRPLLFLRGRAGCGPPTTPRTLSQADLLQRDGLSAPSAPGHGTEGFLAPWWCFGGTWGSAPPTPQPSQPRLFAVGPWARSGASPRSTGTRTGLWCKGHSSGEQHGGAQRGAGAGAGPALRGEKPPMIPWEMWGGGEVDTPWDTQGTGTPPGPQAAEHQPLTPPPSPLPVMLSGAGGDAAPGPWQREELISQKRLHGERNEERNAENVTHQQNRPRTGQCCGASMRSGAGPVGTPQNRASGVPRRGPGCEPCMGPAGMCSAPPRALGISGAEAAGEGTAGPAPGPCGGSAPSWRWAWRGRSGAAVVSGWQ